jgi:glycine/D-amino acid oxidase-like deaminating enzyme
MTAASPSFDPGSRASDDGGVSRQSVWHDTADPPPHRAPLSGDITADVAIVGGGYTGLWAAYYLTEADPSLRVVVLEKETVGFGASGRNGGWCSAIFPASAEKVAKHAGRDATIRLFRELQRTVDEVGRVTAAEGIDAHFDKGGMVTLARNRAQLLRAEQEVASARRWGFGEDDRRLLGKQETLDIAAATDVLGGVYTPHCAAIHPLRLARGLADVVERRGITIHESTPVLDIRPGEAMTDRGTVRAGVVIRGTEGFTPDLKRFHRSVIPIYSLMVATEPLPPEVWDEIGLRGRETFADNRHLRIYGQRTADGRLAFGGRGAPYHYGSRVRPAFDLDDAVHAGLRRTLLELFPVLREVRFTHRWGGPLAIARDWLPSVGIDRANGLAWAGGYVGDGVALTNLAGRTLAHLLTGNGDDALSTLPWVEHRSPRWEPEPLRWLGINAGIRVMATADTNEARTGKPARRASVVGRFTGH